MKALFLSPVTHAHLEAYRQHIIKNYNDTGVNPGFSVEFEFGSKYIRVVTVMGNTMACSRSSHSFVEKSTGLIWKAASWKAPAKNFSRGSVLDNKTYAPIRWTGV